MIPPVAHERPADMPRSTSAFDVGRVVHVLGLVGFAAGAFLVPLALAFPAQTVARQLFHSVRPVVLATLAAIVPAAICLALARRSGTRTYGYAGLIGVLAFWMAIVLLGSDALDRLAREVPICAPDSSASGNLTPWITTARSYKRASDSYAWL
jgi:hypothetical protein